MHTSALNTPRDLSQMSKQSAIFTHTPRWDMSGWTCCHPFHRTEKRLPMPTTKKHHEEIWWYILMIQWKYSYEPKKNGEVVNILATPATRENKAPRGLSWCLKSVVFSFRRIKTAEELYFCALGGGDDVVGGFVMSSIALVVFFSYSTNLESIFHQQMCVRE